MKRLLMASVFILLIIAGCSNTNDVKTEDVVTNNEPQKDIEPEEDSGPTQEELNNKLKQGAEEVQLTKIQNDEYSKGDKVYVIGEVGAAEGTDEVIQKFTLNSKDWIYEVSNLSDYKVSKGDNVKVYGTYDGESDAGMPIISSTVVDNE